MSLLREIQSSLMSDQTIGPILLKLRFLASRLGSNLLEEWVKHESEGYPSGADVPAYRKVGISYIGHFNGPFGAAINNAPIPPYLIEKFAGKQWNSYRIGEGIASMEELIASSKEGGTLSINASNLCLLLSGEVYPDYACNSVKGTISTASLVGIQAALRARVLELTIQLEKAIPAATEITIGPIGAIPTRKDKEAITHITHQVIHGNYTTISNSGAAAQFSLTINANDVGSVANELKAAGLSAEDAKEIAGIFSAEKPESETEPFGKKAKVWIAKNLVKATNGTWKIGLAVATQLLTEAAKKYYGLG